MGLSALFQRFFRPEQERVAFRDIAAWIERKEREESVHTLIDDRINRFVKDLDEQLTILEAIDIEDRKADQRAKAITMGNLQKYLTHVKNLKNRLEKKESFPVINDLLADFYRRSENNYQRATLLIGKELTPKTLSARSDDSSRSTRRSSMPQRPEPK